MSLIALTLARSTHSDKPKSLDGWAKAALVVDAIIATALITMAALAIAHANGATLPTFLRKVALMTSMSKGTAQAIAGGAGVWMIINAAIAIKLLYYNRPSSASQESQTAAVPAPSLSSHPYDLNHLKQFELEGTNYARVMTALAQRGLISDDQHTNNVNGQLNELIRTVQSGTAHPDDHTKLDACLACIFELGINGLSREDCF